MSRENVEVVRRGVEACNRGDLDAALGMYDPQAVVTTLLSGTARGREQLRAVIERREEEIGPVQYRPEEFIDTGETVVGVVRGIHARGRVSGIGVEDFVAAPQLAFVWTFRSGLIVGQEMFRSRAEARDVWENIGAEWGHCGATNTHKQPQTETGQNPRIPLRDRKPQTATTLWTDS